MGRICWGADGRGIGRSEAIHTAAALVARKGEASRRLDLSEPSVTSSRYVQIHVSLGFPRPRRRRPRPSPPLLRGPVVHSDRQTRPPRHVGASGRQMPVPFSLLPAWIPSHCFGRPSCWAARHHAHARPYRPSLPHSQGSRKGYRETSVRPSTAPHHRSAVRQAHHRCQDQGYRKLPLPPPTSPRLSCPPVPQSSYRRC